jgi:hypothetical protein
MKVLADSTALGERFVKRVETDRSTRRCVMLLGELM